MKTHYYLSLSPIEALIASHLEPQQFGSYMAIGSKNGSRERMMFVELRGEFGDYFDWAYAAERCVPHEDGRAKNSVWMSVYRVIENVPLDQFGTLYLTTADGRTLPIEPSTEARFTHRAFYVYQELAPLTPLVVSRLTPVEFAHFMTDPGNHVAVPTVVFADLKVIDFDDLEKTGNLGATYDRNIEHLKSCVKDVTTLPDKPNKNVERSIGGFGYQIIQDGIYVGHRDRIVEYPMPDLAVIRRDHYDWGRSALIL